MAYKRPLKFELICEDLRSKILLGQFDAEGRLPSEEALSVTFKCSRPTIRKALEKLQIEGVINTVQGSGSYIKGPALSASRAATSDTIPSDSFFGLIFPNLGNGYIFDSISNYVATYLAAKGYSLIWGGYLSPHSESFISDLNQICERYIQLGVKGVFFSPFEYTPQRGQANHSVLATFAKAGIPVVLLDSDVDEFPVRNPFDLVSLDHIADCYNLCDHLLSQGIKRLVFFAPPASMETIRLRLIGYHEALIVHGITPHKDWFVVCDPTNIEGVQRMFSEHKPEGIVCSNDGTAVLLMKTMKELNIKVPNDVIVGAFDNLSYLSDLNVPLTSMMQPVQAMGRIAVKVLFQRIAEPDIPVQTIRLSGKLIIRKSSIKPN